jgi:hypothetical protein
MMKKSFLLLIATLLCGSVFAFEPSGKPVARIFGNFHSGLTAANNNAVFEIDRALLGYSYQMSSSLSAAVVVDIGSPGDESVYAMVKRYAYFRNAYINYKQGDFSFSFGIIGMNHFKVQESFWGYRYLKKSFADQYKFGQSVDLGIAASYKINDLFSADAAIVNGEGYSQLQQDNQFEYTAGLTFQLPEKLTGRVFANFGPSENKAKMVYAAFLGYHLSPKLSLGGEYNLLNNYRYIENRNQYGFSFYSTYKLKESWKAFARYDLLKSNLSEGESTPWNLAKDGTALIAGIEKQVNKQLKLSLNYQDWYPTAANLENSAYVYLNVEFKL